MAQDRPAPGRHFHVVAADLRGYGDSVGPEDGGENHINYSFRAMAQDQVEVMERLGYREFFAAGHDRGARTTHRMCLDHPDRVKRAAVIDILPNYHIWTHASKNWALKSWHWLFMAQPYDMPERMMAGVPAQYFMEKKLSKARHRSRLFRSRGVCRICPLLQLEDDPWVVRGLPRLPDLRLRDGRGRPEGRP